MDSQNLTGGGLRYLSVCSGIEAATQAWHHMGWSPVAFSEIDKFPAAVLAHHYPSVSNLGDMTKFQEWPDLDINLLVGGTPCQSFSVAGLRKGLADPRGNLMLTYLAIADRYQPEWLVWENVPGVLSSAGGRDFGTFLGALGALGYGFAYRVLDAQFFGVPQRRRRVFVVGHLGDWRRAAAVLFERHSLQGHPAPSREKREGATPATRTGLESGVGQYHRIYGTDDPIATLQATGSAGGPFSHAVAIHCADIAGTIDAHYGDKWGLENQHINAGAPNFVTHSLRGEGFDASEDGTGRGTPLVPISIQAGAIKENPDHGPGGIGVRTDDTAYTLEARAEVQAVQRLMQVRRLTPRECERLQGFPDDYTLIPHTHGKPAADGPRYKALGNSMAVPVMRWIGERIALVDWLMKDAA